MSLNPDLFSPIRFTRGLIFTFEEFLHDFRDSDVPTTDFSYITGAPAPVGPHSYIRRTLINDLRPSAEAILAGFNDKTRQYINYAMKNKVCSHEYITHPTDADLVRASIYAAKFAQTMKIPPITLNYMRALNSAGRFHISYIYDLSGNVLGGHGYRLSAARPELAYSFREIEDINNPERRKLLLKTNRYSHYCDMLSLKSLGYEEYDFGGLSDGLSDNAKWNHIDEFKMCFRGRAVTNYNSILYNTIKSKTYLMIRGRRV